jgi:hypothetical protein
MSQDMFRQANEQLLKENGWVESGGTLLGSMLWRDPEGGGNGYTLDEAVKIQERRAERARNGEL